MGFAIGKLKAGRGFPKFECVPRGGGSNRLPAAKAKLPPGVGPPYLPGARLGWRWWAASPCGQRGCQPQWPVVIRRVGVATPERGKAKRRPAFVVRCRLGVGGGAGRWAAPPLKRQLRPRCRQWPPRGGACADKGRQCGVRALWSPSAVQVPVRVGLGAYLAQRGNWVRFFACFWRSCLRGRRRFVRQSGALGAHRCFASTERKEVGCAFRFGTSQCYRIAGNFRAISL